MNDTRTPPASATLTERYVQAVTRSIPEAQRDDVAAELRGSIADQLDARIEAGEPAEAAERAVLTALGDPDKLAAGMIDRPLHLIGPRYYLDWWRLLKLLLWIVPPIAAFGIALGQTLAGAPIGAIIGTTIGGTLTVIVHLAFWTAFVFFLIERYEVGGAKEGGVSNPWTLDDLPEVHATRARFADMVVNLVFLALAAAVLVWDQLFGLVYLDGRWMSFLDPGLWPGWMGGLLIVLAVEAAFQVVLYVRGRWTVGLAVANTVLNLVVAVPAVWLLSQGMLLNREFWDAVIPDDPEKVYGILSVLTGFGIAAIAIWDTIDGFLKARRAGS